MSTAASGFAGVLLAAGRSSRMGRPKALLPLAGSTVMERLVAVFARAGLDPVLVVASGPTLELARRLPDARSVEGDADAPMIDSLARALEHAPHARGVVVQPIDAPLTTEEMIAKLLAGSPSRSRVLVHEGVPGHPVLVLAAEFDAIRTRPEGGLRRILDALPAERVEANDARVLADVDTPEDVARWLP